LVFKDSQESPLSTEATNAMSKTTPKTSKTVKTEFGIVSRAALEELQKTFDTTELLSAVDAIDQVRYCDDGLRTDVLTLHRMAMNLINQNYGVGTKSEESIGELAERLTGDILSCIAYLKQAYEAIKPLETLIADPDEEWDAKEI
jgi:hypothetical protein